MRYERSISNGCSVVTVSLSLVLSACSGEKTAVAKKPQPSPETSQPPLPAGVTLKQLSRAPVPIPAPYKTLETYELTAKEEAFGEGQLEVRIPKSHVDGSDEYLTELYRYENGEYIKEQIEGEPNQFHFYVGRYWTEEGKPTGDYKATYVIARAKRADLEKGFGETGGFFNGIYGECSEGTMSSFGKCVAIPSDEKITGQALPAGGEGIKFVSLNAGNASIYFYSYVYKMCSFATEERARNQIVNTIKPDLAVIQEVWNGQCSRIASERRDDKVCSSQLKEKMKNGAHPEQIKRLFTPDLYDTSCAPLSAGGYECIALRKGVFKFEESSLEVATGVAKQIANTPNYCDEDSSKGKDTGFYGRTVSLVNPKGPYSMPFDLWNAHLASPLNLDAFSGNNGCRAQQIAALVKAYKNTYRKLLIAGDFNTNYHPPLISSARDTTMLRNVVVPFETEIEKEIDKKVSPDKNYIAYMVSDQNDPTAYSIPINPQKYDHVMSNFADVASLDKCRRIAIDGLDHHMTSCLLYGFDTGTVETGLMLMDQASRFFKLVPSSVNVFRKGVKMNWVKWKNGILHNIYLPDNVNTMIKLEKNCISSKVLSGVGVGQTVSYRLHLNPSLGCQ